MSTVQELLEQKTVPAADQLRMLVCTSDEARNQAKTLLEETRDKRGEARDHHGLLAWALGHPARAIETLEGADSPHTAYALGLSLQETSRTEEAVSALKKAARGEKHPSARIALLRARAVQGEAEEVLKDLKAMIKEGEDSAAVHDAMGQAYEALGDYTQAVEAYQAALARDPQHAPALFHLAYQCDLRGLDDEALGLYERCCQTNPAYAAAFVNLGVLYEDRGEFEKAASCFRVVLDADPAHLRAKLFLKDAESSLHMYYDEELEKVADERRQILALPITEFELSVRARNCLKKMSVETLGDLVQRTEEELLGFRNFGETSLREVKKLLSDKGLRLGMAPEALLEYRPPVVTAESLQKPIADLHLSVRAHSCMEQLGIVTMGDLTKKSKTDLMNARNFGRTSLKEVMDKLGELGLGLADG